MNAKLAVCYEPHNTYFLWFLFLYYTILIYEDTVSHCLYPHLWGYDDNSISHFIEATVNDIKYGGNFYEEDINGH